MSEEEWEKWEKEERARFRDPEAYPLPGGKTSLDLVQEMPLKYQAVFTRMSQKYAEEMASLATATAKSSARAAWASASAAWASFAVAVLSLVFQGVPALLDALRFASKQ